MIDDVIVLELNLYFVGLVLSSGDLKEGRAMADDAFEVGLERARIMNVSPDDWCALMKVSGRPNDIVDLIVQLGGLVVAIQYIALIKGQSQIKEHILAVFFSPGQNDSDGIEHCSFVELKIGRLWPYPQQKHKICQIVLLVVR